MKSLALALSIAVFASALAFADDEEPKESLFPAFLNAVPGFGLGSFVQGDTVGGLICLSCEGIGGSSFGMGLVFMFVDKEVSDGLFWAGLGLWCGAKIFGIIRPFCYARSYNEEHGLASLSIAPSLTAGEGGTLDPGLVLKLSY